MNKKLLDEIAETIRGECPAWRGNTGLPTNAFSQRRYSGMSALILLHESMRRQYTSRWWATYKQWAWVQCKVKSRPDNVPEGEWGVKLIRLDEEEGKRVAKPFLVFNGMQIFGADATKWKQPFTVHTLSEYNQVAGEAIRLTKAPVSRLADLIGWFRKDVADGDAFEALVAEIGRCYLESELCLPHDEDMTEYRKYRGEWLENMSNWAYLISAVRGAEKVVDSILGRKDREGE